MSAKRNYPSTEALTHNILEHWHKASAVEVQAGRAWYDNARDAAARLALGGRISTEVAAAYIAAHSPRTHWRTTVARAAHSIATGEHIGLPEARASCERIAAGAELPAAFSELPDGAPKVKAFWRNITGDDHDVTCDVWAARAAGFTHRLDGRGYAYLRDAYQTAARTAGVSPRTLQATVWVHVRGGAD